MLFLHRQYSLYHMLPYGDMVKALGGLACPYVDDMQPPIHTSLDRDLSFSCLCSPAFWNGISQSEA